MGNQSNVKQMRGQLRIISKEILPEVLNEEMIKAQYAQLQKEMRVKLSLIEADVKDTLTRIDERARDLQTFMMRQVANNVIVPSDQPQKEGEVVNESKTEGTAS